MKCNSEYCFERSGKCDDKCLCDCHQNQKVPISTELVAHPPECGDCKEPKITVDGSAEPELMKWFKDLIDAAKHKERLRTLEEVISVLKKRWGLMIDDEEIRLVEKLKEVKPHE